MSFEEVVEKIQNLYFGDGDEDGEAMFKSFAAKHAHLFAEGCDAMADENKLE